MTVFDPTPSYRWLFCMTHPDDEISICGWIDRLVRSGNEVFMSWTHSTPVREAEGRAVAKILGVPDDHLFFFGATDGSVCDELADLLPRFRSMMEAVHPDRVACGAFEQGHLDHDSTNWLVNQTFSGVVCEIPFYHTYLTRLQVINRFSDPSGEEMLPLYASEVTQKVQIARSYPSQNIWRVLMAYEIFQVCKLRRAELRFTERMRIQTHRDFGVPNHPPRLANRVKRGASWQRWLKALARVSPS